MIAADMLVIWFMPSLILTEVPGSLTIADLTLSEITFISLIVPTIWFRASEDSIVADWILFT